MYISIPDQPISVEYSYFSEEKDEDEYKTISIPLKKPKYIFEGKKREAVIIHGLTLTVFPSSLEIDEKGQSTITFIVK